jgi:hypothetical protein
VLNSSLPMVIKLVMQAIDRDISFMKGRRVCLEGRGCRDMSRA